VREREREKVSEGEGREGGREGEREERERDREMATLDRKIVRMISSCHTWDPSPTLQDPNDTVEKVTMFSLRFPCEAFFLIKRNSQLSR
jgi:hypothetical protein